MEVTMDIISGVVGLAVTGQELVQAFQGPLEVEAYKLYLDLWWEWQFIMDPSLLEPIVGC